MSKFIPQQKNANKHTLHGTRLLEKSVTSDGWIDAQTSAADGEMISGTARLELAEDKFAGVEPIVIDSDGTRPVIIRRTDIPDLNDPRAKRLSIAANQIAHTDLSFDSEILKEWGNEDAAIKAMFAESEWTEITGEEKPTVDAEAQIDRAAELLEKWKVVSGDMFAIGEHRLICGDCTDKAVVARVTGGEKADMVITDPPYGMELNADYSSLTSSNSFGKGKKHDAVIGDDKAFDASLVIGCDCKEQVWFGADYYARTLGDTERSGSWLVWDKRLTDSADLMYGSCFELAWSKQKHKRDVLRHKWAGFFTDGEKRDFTHPTTKPVSLISEVINICGDGLIVYDPFSGSGTTLVACQNLSRRGRAVEISPAYCAVTLERMSTAFPELEIKRIE